MERNEQENITITREAGLMQLATLIDDMWKGFRRFFLLLVPLLVLGIGGMCLKTWWSYTPTYQAYASMVVTAQNSVYYTTTYYSSASASQLDTTFPYILSSSALKSLVKEELGLSSLPVTISSSVLEDTALFTITVEGEDPQLVYDILQSVLRNYPEAASTVLSNVTLSLLDESGVPTIPTSEADYINSGMKGALLSLAVFLCILFFYAVTRKTVRREEDLKRHLSLECLGKIPWTKQKRRSESKSLLVGQTNSNSEVNECFRTMRTRVTKFCTGNGAQRIMLTSTAAGEGKTTVAVNLAVSLAQRGLRVLLVDCDLRNPSIAKVLGMGHQENGVAELLAGKVEVSDVIKDYSENLKVIPGGEPRTNPTRLLDGRRVNAMLSKVDQDLDFVIVDTPPCGILSDATLVARSMDYAIMVIRQDYARLDRVLNGVAHIVETNTRLVGYVMNGTEVGITGYGYGYGYGYGKYGYGKYGYGRYGYGYGKYGYGYGYGNSGKSTKKSKKSKPAQAPVSLEDEN